jgi:hypothetical protein
MLKMRQFKSNCSAARPVEEEQEQEQDQEQEQEECQEESLVLALQTCWRSARK